MACKKRLLRQYYWKERFNSSDSSKWISKLPKILEKSIEQTPLFQRKKDTFLTSGPRLWIYMQIHYNTFLTSQQLYGIYNEDQEAKSQNFFESLNQLKQEHLHNYLRLGHIHVAPFEKFKEPYKGYSLVSDKAYSLIHPQILMSLDPLPDTWQVKYYNNAIQKFLNSSENDNNEVKIENQTSSSKGFKERFKIFGN